MNRLVEYRLAIATRDHETALKVLKSLSIENRLMLRREMESKLFNSVMVRLCSQRVH